MIRAMVGGSGIVREIIATVAKVLASDLNNPERVGTDVVFRERAAVLLQDLLPVLDWLGTHRAFPLNIDTIRCAFEWTWLCSLAELHVVLLQDRGSGAWKEFCAVLDMPESLLAPLQSYVSEMASAAIPVSQDASDETEPERLHRFATMYFMHGFTRLRCNIAHWVH